MVPFGENSLVEKDGLIPIGSEGELDDYGFLRICRSMGALSVGLM